MKQMYFLIIILALYTVSTHMLTNIIKETYQSMEIEIIKKTAKDFPK